MRSAIVLSLLVLLFGGTALAKDPPPLKGPAPSPWLTENGHPDQDVNPAVFDGPISRVPITDVTSSAKLPIETIVRKPKVSSLSIPSHVTSMLIPSSLDIRYNAIAGANVGHEAESAVYTTRFNGTDSTVTAFMWLTNNHWITDYATSTALTSDSATFTRGTLTIPANYNETVDPWLTGNPYATGQRPGVVYLTTLAGYRSSPTAALGNPMAVRVYASDDGGITWTTGADVATTTSASGYELDKPVADVSWYSGTLGYLYVAWVEVVSGGAYRIRVRRNWGGLWVRCRPVGGGCDTSWDAAITVAPGVPDEYATAPQVVVNPNNGNVYVFWRTSPCATCVPRYGELRMARSTDYGVTFSSPITLVQNIRVTGNNGFLANGVRAVVVPTIKYNSGTNRIMAVWHAATANTPTNQTALYYAAFDPDVVSSPIITNPTPILDSAGMDVQPAIDNDASGNMFVSYYGTTAGNETLYQQYGICVNSSGTRTCGPTPLEGTQSATRFIGDYHESYYWSFIDTHGARWNTVWSRNGADLDVLVTGVK